MCAGQKISLVVLGLCHCAVLKYADSVLKGYATASKLWQHVVIYVTPMTHIYLTHCCPPSLVSVIMTGMLSMLLFGTRLSVMYGLGIVNVIIAVLLYNGRRETLERFVC